MFIKASRTELFGWLLCPVLMVLVLSAGVQESLLCRTHVDVHAGFNVSEGAAEEVGHQFLGSGSVGLEADPQHDSLTRPELHGAAQHKHKHVIITRLHCY